jgi:diguanylate cyclase (GGDEF)-like protein
MQSPFLNDRYFIALPISWLLFGLWRYGGGNKCTVILPGTETPEDAEKVARKQHSALSAPFALEDAQQPFHISALIGTALYPDHGETEDALLSVSDDAMDAALKSGRHTFRCSSTPDLSDRHSTIFTT